MIYYIYNNDIDYNVIKKIKENIIEDYNYFKGYKTNHTVTVNFCNTPTVSSDAMSPYEKLFDKHTTKTFIPNLIVCKDCFHKNYYILYNSFIKNDNKYLQIILCEKLYNKCNNLTLDKDDIGRLGKLIDLL